MAVRYLNCKLKASGIEKMLIYKTYQQQLPAIYDYSFQKVWMTLTFQRPEVFCFI